MSDNRKFTPGAYGLPASEPEPAPTVKWDGITWVPCDGPQAPQQPSPDGTTWVWQGSQFVPLSPTSAAGPAESDTVVIDGVVAYAGYSHPADASVSFCAEPTFNVFGNRAGTICRWVVRGRLTGSTRAELMGAYSDAQLAHEFGGGMLTHAGNAMGYVQKATLSFPSGRGAEYVTALAYEAVYEIVETFAGRPQNANGRP